MNAVRALGAMVTVLALGAGPARAGLLFHKTKCCCPPPPVSLHAEVLQRRYTVETQVKNAPVAKTRVVQKDVPCTRMVPVSVLDPCTGRMRVEEQPRKVVEKVSYIVIDVCPPEKPYSVQKEEKVEQCLKVQVVPLPVAPQDR